MTRKTGTTSHSLGAAATLALAGLLLLAACSSNGGNLPQETLPLPPVSSAAPIAGAAPEESPSAPAKTAGETPPSPTAAAPSTVSAFPDPGSAHWVQFLTGLVKPTDLESAGDGSGRLFILEQPGRIRVVEKGQLLERPFLDITGQVGSQGSEQGLLGLAFHPQYAQNGIFFTNYTDRDGTSVVSQWRVSADANLADPQSEQVLLTVAQPYANHNGGGVVFGPDGLLYLSFGDGGSAGDPQGNAQNTQTLLGSILRIRPDLQGGYTIPAGNPFAGGQGGLPEIYLYGLRNPWRFSFDGATGDLYIADVGQNQWEEIDYLPAGSPGGENFGWNYYEGNHPYQGRPPADVQLVFPVYEYSHAVGCSVTGGYVYRGQALAGWQGIYLFGDYCSGTVWGLLKDPQGQWQSQQLFQTGLRISAFGQDENGELYLLDHGQGQLLRLEPQ